MRSHARPLRLLPEWEASLLDYPNPMLGPLEDLAARQFAVCAKFTMRGGASRDYFIGLAASLGLDITIQQFAPFYASFNRVGDRLFDNAWAFVWCRLPLSIRARRSISACRKTAWATDW